MNKKNPFLTVEAIPMALLCIGAIGWGVVCLYQNATMKSFRYARKGPAFPFELPEGFFENEQNVPSEDSHE